MKLLLLYGPPAVGKLTIARELARHTGWRLFHNHLTVDLVLSVYDFGSPGFVALREEIWLAVLRRALADGRPGLIFTFNPENSVPQRFIDQLFGEVTEAGGEVILVELTAAEAEIERRLGSDERRQRGKLVDRELYKKLRSAGAFATPVLPRPALQIDTGAVTALHAAARIMRFLESLPA